MSDSPQVAPVEEARKDAPLSIEEPSNRLLEDDRQHTPAVSSPLNPELTSAKPRKTLPAREQREKKDSLKKREAKGEDAIRAGTPDKQVPRGSKKASEAPQSQYMELQRYRINPPKAADYQPPGVPVTTPGLDLGKTKFYSIAEHVHNKRGYRYVHAIADPQFPHMKFNRQTDAQPYDVRFDYEDSSGQIQFSEDAKAITTDKGWRMTRANVALREGKWYWELKVLSGIRYASNPTVKVEEGSHFGGHFRAGISRREASLEHPVGFDAYSYGIRDVHGQKIHMSSPDKFFPPEESMVFGDVIGLELNLPSLGLHRKVVEGTYNKAVDVIDNQDSPTHDTLNAHTLIRDRYPVRYKNELYFEYLDYQPSKDLEELFLPPMHSAPASAAAAKPPHPNHPQPALRTLPGSYLKVFRNGKYMGTAFEDLLAFLPPASKPASGTREGLDDGTLGYYPSVSVYSGGAVEANFGPTFTYPPPELAAEDDIDMVGESVTTNIAPSRRVRPVCERYNEQIAEDIVYDVVDEVDCWAQDGGVLSNESDLPAVSLIAQDAQILDNGPGNVMLQNSVTRTGEVKTLDINDD